MLIRIGIELIKVEVLVGLQLLYIFSMKSGKSVKEKVKYHQVMIIKVWNRTRYSLVAIGLVGRP